MQNKLVLIACEESQRVCKAFRDRGFTAFSADIQEPSGGHPEWHILGDVTPLLKGCCDFKTMSGDTYSVSSWDLVIAHPPCTYLSNAGARHLWKGHELQSDRVMLGIQGRDLFMRFWWADIPLICVENPVPSKVFCLPPYTQAIQPYQFGHPYTKKTCLWLKGLSPLKRATELPAPPPMYISQGRKPKKIGWCEGMRGTTNGQEGRARARSKTFPGIAKAMAEQWG